MSALQEQEVEFGAEMARIEGWRLDQLVEAGYPNNLAEKLAANHGVDLHLAVEMVGQGCPHETAARILL